MTKIHYKIATGLATAGILAGIMAPSAFAATVTIRGNGALSVNKVKVKNTKTTAVMQSSHTSVSTSVNSSANTGGNSSSFNTGGNTSITTGAARNTTTVTVTGGSNVATLPTCDTCGEDDSDITIRGNGALSTNSVQIVSSQTTVIGQSTSTCVATDITSTANTGGNSSSFNTGSTSSITTSNAVNETTVDVTGGSNEVL